MSTQWDFAVGRSAVAVLGGFLCLQMPQSHAADTSVYNQYERQALKVVHDWDEAWRSKDAQKIAQYMAADVVMDNPTKMGELEKGSDAFIADYNNPKTGYQGIDHYEVVARSAVGGPEQAAVIEKRRDHVTVNGKHMVFSFAGYFELRNGKITRWHEVQLAPFPPGLFGPPPPANK